MLYTKVIDGKTVIKKKNQIVVIKDGKQIINPKEEILLEDGWVKYETPTPVEPEETVDTVRERKRKEIMAYDSSTAVNEFYINGIPVWLDKATRAGLMLRFQAEKATGKSETSLWYGDMQFPLSLDNAFAMLYAIEIYASACYDNTQRHLAAVDKLKTIKKIEEYNYFDGYPEKLSL